MPPAAKRMTGANKAIWIAIAQSRGYLQPGAAFVPLPKRGTQAYTQLKAAYMVAGVPPKKRQLRKGKKAASAAAAAKPPAAVARMAALERAHTRIPATTEEDEIY